MSVNVWATVTVVDSSSTTCGESPSFSGQDCTILKSEIKTSHETQEEIILEGTSKIYLNSSLKVPTSIL